MFHFRLGNCTNGFIVGLLAATAYSARADLGQTSAEVEARWGKPIPCQNSHPEPGTEMVCYHRPGFPTDVIQVTYFDGISQRERYRRFTSPKLEAEDAEAPIAEKEIDAILKANSAGRTWNAVKIFDSRRWFLAARDMHRAPASALVNGEDGIARFPMVVQTYAMGVRMGLIEEDAHTPKSVETLFKSH